MNYQVFNYMPPSNATQRTTDLYGASRNAAGQPPSHQWSSSTPRPIRVTPSAISPLLYTILYSIEFQSPVGPHPPPLKDQSIRLGGGGASSNGGASTAGTQAAAFLSSAVSVMSGFWGRSTSTAATVAPRASSAFPGNSSMLSSSIADPRLSFEEQVELAALQHQHDQSFVVPVTQIIHKFGGIHITVRETHNPSIANAYARAMEEIEQIVAEHERRVAKLPPRPLAPTSISPQHSSIALGRSIPDQSEAAYLQRSSPSFLKVMGSGPNAADPAGHSHRVDPRCAPASPLVDGNSISGHPSGSPASDGTTSASYWAGAGSLFTPATDEVGMVLSVRLLSKEITRWRVTHERPLAEWNFPIIRTSSENLVCHFPRRDLRSGVASVDSRPPMIPPFPGEFDVEDPRSATASASSAVNYGSNSSCGDLIMVNDGTQIHHLLEFILKSSYQSISLETFTDFTSGELLFDVQVKVKRHF